MAALNAEVTAKPTRQSAGQDARLYGRRDARRYAKQVLGEESEKTSSSLLAPRVRPKAH